MGQKSEIRAHVEYPHEKTRLDETVQKIDARLEKEERVMPGGIHKGANQYLAETLYQNASARIEVLTERRKNPYFGRIDYISDGTLVTVYIGGEVLHEDHYGEHKVASRHSEAASIFARSSPGKYHYERAGSIDLLLQRHLEIKLGQLHDFSDNFDTRPEDKSSKRTYDPGELTGRERHLIEVLYSRGAARLQDIVETIQEHQDDLIRAPADQCLVINGVAGSGKTSVAYHRLDFLVHAGNQTIKPENTIVFGPNKVFLNHVRELLPQLGVQGVVETTFYEWAFDAMGFGTSAGAAEQKRYNLQDVTLKTWLRQVILDRVGFWGE